MESLVLRRSLIELDRRRKNPDENQKGFTLIELLVVIIIIGILAAIAIPLFLNQRESAWKSSVASDLKNAAIVVETYGTSNNGSYASFPDVAAITSAAASSKGIRPSPGNTITVTIDATAPAGRSFTIVGSNENIKITGSGATGTGFQTYDSANGGLKKFQ
jgi:type IV pilus assembly protein PilA